MDGSCNNDSIHTSESTERPVRKRKARNEDIPIDELPLQDLYILIEQHKLHLNVFAGYQYLR